MKKCVFAGSFDPFTVGHEDTVRQCLSLFDEVVVAVACNHSKQYLFSAEERAEMVKAVFSGEERVRVLVWEGAVADLLKQENAPFYVRGVRNATDFIYETEDFYASRDIFGDFTALYIPAEREHAYISSTLVKNCIAFGKPYEDYVPQAVHEFIRRKTLHV